MRYLFAALCLLLSSLYAPAQQLWPTSLILTPEKTDFVKTSTHAEVLAFLDALKTQSREVQVLSMGKSAEGKNIPLVVLASGGPATPASARAQGKLVVYVQGNIHAGEVEGKEAIMMLLREILLGDKRSLLDHQVILFAPIYNPDSNDKMERGRRPSQEDSPLEVGLRENSQGLDLNRDGVKLEAHETKALFSAVINYWDPHVFVDLHTTNGTWHAYNLTWAPSYHYAGERATYDYTNSVMLPAITKAAHEKYGLRLGPYGDYELAEGWPVKNFYTYNHHPRYLVNQFSLRNRLAILSEAFSHERFYQRIHSTRAFTCEILSYTNEHAAEILRLTAQAESDAMKAVLQGAGKTKKGVRFKMISGEKLDDFITYDYNGVKNTNGEITWYRTGNIVSYDNVSYYGQFEPTLTATLPAGYIIPAKQQHIVQHLQKLGIRVDTLRAARSFAGEVFHATSLEHAPELFEGHAMATLQGSFAPAVRKFRNGDFIVRLDQPLANLAFYVLEPQSDDGLVNWNFFDGYFKAAGIGNKVVEYPVFKYYK